MRNTKYSLFGFHAKYAEKKIEWQKCAKTFGKKYQSGLSNLKTCLWSLFQWVTEQQINIYQLLLVAVIPQFQNISLKKKWF